MRTPRTVLVVVCWIVSSSGGSAWSTNVHFLRGDAFFHFVLDEAGARRLVDERYPVFEYVRPRPNEITFCGNAGHAALRWPEMPASYRKALWEAWRAGSEARRERQRSPSQGDREASDDDDEATPVRIHVLVYNAAFRLERHHLALKYNERWVEELREFGVAREHASLDPFVRSAALLSLAWRDAETVPALGARLPRAGEARGALIAPRRARLFVLLDDDFEGYAQARAGKRLIAIDADGARVLEGDRGRWVPRDEAER